MGRERSSIDLIDAFRSSSNIIDDEEFAIRSDGFTDTLKNKWQKLTPDERVYITNIGLLFAFQFADLASTKVLMSEYGVSSEINPLGRFTMEKYGFTGSTILKLGAVGVVLTFAESVRRINAKQKSRVNNSLRTGNAIAAAVAVINTMQLL